jgi:hypothetical protein
MPEEAERLNCVTISVRAIDHNDAPVSDMESQLRTHDAGAITERKKLGGAGHVTFHVRARLATNYVDLFGPGNYRTQTSGDFTKDGEYIFKFLKCDDALDMPPET